MRKRVLIIALCTGVLWGGPALADDADMAVFERAWAAFKSGEFAKAWDGFTNGAENYLGSMYEDGLVVTEDHGEAVKWYRSAAEHGVAEAQLNLGFMYAEGRGVSQTTAWRWSGTGRPPARVLPRLSSTSPSCTRTGGAFRLTTPRR